MKKMIKTLLLGVFCVFALCTHVSADVAAAPMFITIGLIYLLIAAVVVIAIALIVKLIIRLVKNRK